MPLVQSDALPALVALASSLLPSSGVSGAPSAEMAGSTMAMVPPPPPPGAAGGSARDPAGSDADDGALLSYVAGAIGNLALGEACRPIIVDAGAALPLVQVLLAGSGGAHDATGAGAGVRPPVLAPVPMGAEQTQ